MERISISIGRESSDDEFKAIEEAFHSDKAEVHIDANLMRLSGGQLPMTVMMWVASGLAPNIMWDLIKYAFNKMLADTRLRQRKPTIVVRRKTRSYEIVIADGIYRTQSAEETITFNSLEELIEYDKAKQEQPE